MKKKAKKLPSGTVVVNLVYLYRPETTLIHTQQPTHYPYRSPELNHNLPTL